MMEFREVTAGYGGAPVLRGLSLTLPDGGITALLGPNGCGKSTLLKAAAGLLKPSGGQVLLNGKAIGSYKGRDLAHQVAYLPQARPVPALTAERMVMHGRFPYLGYPRRYRPQDWEAAARAMEAVDLLPLRHREMDSLSGGERQKVYIAMALAQETPIVLLDEPTTYLDIDRQLEVMRLCAGMRDAGKTVVMVLHDLPLAFRFADRIYLMQNGALAACGTPQELCQSQALEPVFHVRTGRVSLPDGTEQYVFY